jgi:hypothetical protein
MAIRPALERRRALGQAVDRDQSGPTRPLPTKNMQLMAQGNDLKFQFRPATESVGKNGNDGTREREHAGDIMAVRRKTLDFSPPSEFSVGTPPGKWKFG